MSLYYVDKLKFFAQEVLPSVYDESLSYYEVLNKVSHKLNETITSVNNQNDVIDDFIHTLVSEYDANKSYLVGEYCRYNENIYKCVSDTTGNWDATKWTEVVFVDSIGDDIIAFKSSVNTIINGFNNLITTAIAHIASPYDSNHNYEIGDYVSYVGVVYKCIANTTGEFDSSDWESVVIVDELFNYMTEMWSAFITDYMRNLGVEDRIGDSKYLVSSESVLKQMLENFNSIPKFTFKANNEKIFSWNGYECTASYSANADFQFTNIVNSPTELPDYFEAGNTYTMYCKRSGENVRIEAYWFDEDSQYELMSFGATRKFTVPDGTVGCIIRIVADPSTSSYEETIIGGIMDGDTTNNNLFEIVNSRTPYYRGILDNNSDVNECEQNTLWALTYGYNYSNAPNVDAGYVITIGETSSSNTSFQMCVDFFNGTLWTRNKQSNSWGEWSPNNIVNELGNDTTKGASQYIVTSMLDMFNSKPIIPLKGTTSPFFEWNGYECTVKQGANSSFIFNNMYYSTTELPSGMVSGGKYYMYCSTTNTKVKCEIFWKLTGNNNLVAGPYFTSSGFFTVPDTATGCLIRIYGDGSTTAYTAKIVTGIFNFPNTNNFLYTNGLTYMGAYDDEADVNDCISNSIYTLASSRTYTNAPPVVPATIATIGVYGSLTTAMQISLDFNYGIYYYRNKTAGVWSDWISPSSADSKYAKLYVKGNSIMVGSVWTLQGSEVKYDHHPSTWGNSPYSLVAKRIGVPERNVNTNILHSSTGFLFVPTDPSTGEPATTGSFLDNIVGNQELEIDAANLSTCDYVMTHFWMYDLTNYPIGTSESTAGDGSLVGGVKTLLNYLNTNYPQCRLILVSVPPVDTTIALGGNPFNKNYVYDGNNQTISQLDTVMKALSETYHFKYIDWQNMNLSYYYQKYTGGVYGGNKLNNVHANNEGTYRKMGEYLAEHI